jgi:hypothetical protein
MGEIFQKVPEGYRELTGDEKERFLMVGTSITLLQFQIRQHESELDAAKARAELAQSRIRDAQREMQIALADRDRQNQELRIGYGKEDAIVEGNRVFLIVRPEGWEPPARKTPQGARSETHDVPGVGRVEVTKTAGAPPAVRSEDKKE